MNLAFLQLNDDSLQYGRGSTGVFFEGRAKAASLYKKLKQWPPPYENAWNSGLKLVNSVNLA